MLRSVIMALGVAIVWGHFSRLQSGLSEISERVDWKLAECLQMSSFVMCIMAGTITIFGSISK